MSQGKNLKRIAIAVEAQLQTPTSRDTSNEPRTSAQIKKARRPIMYRLRLWMWSATVARAPS